LEALEQDAEESAHETRGGRRNLWLSNRASGGDDAMAGPLHGRSIVVLLAKGSKTSLSKPARRLLHP
jgi:hypothetical protein